MSLRSPIENEKADAVMPAWIAGIQGRKDGSGNIHINLIIMKAMYTVTAVLSRLDRGGDTLWKTLHWTFTSITPGHEWRTARAESCMQVGWLIAAGASRTSFSDGLPVLRWQSRRWATGTGWSMRSKRAAE